MHYQSRYAWKVAAVLMLAISPAPWAVAQFGGGHNADDAAVVELSVWYLQLSSSKDQPLKHSDWRKNFSSRREVEKQIKEGLKEGAIDRMSCPTFQTIEGQRVSMNVGVKQPRVVATELAVQRQRVTRQVQENTGRIISADVARLSKEKLLVDLTVEDSYMEPMETRDEEESTDSVRMVTFAYNSTVACPDGAVVYAMAATMNDSEGNDQHIVVLVSARLLDGGADESPDEE